MITCILLSAGKSERFGSPKALANVHDKTVIEHIQSTLLQSGCDQVIVVLGAHLKEIQPLILKHKRIRVVYNKDYNLGQTSSVQAGWRSLDPATEGVMFWPVDCPLVKLSSINQIIEHFKKNKPGILIPAYRGQKGHPPVFHYDLKPEILGLGFDTGLNSLFKRYEPQTIAIEDPGIVKSFNTQKEFEEIISKQ